MQELRPALPAARASHSVIYQEFTGLVIDGEALVIDNTKARLDMRIKMILL